MPLKLNGVEITTPKYNGNELDVVKFNGNIVFEKDTGLTELCFTAEEANSTVELLKSGSPSISGTAYSYDRETWVSFTPGETAGSNKITLSNIGDKVYFRNNIIGDFYEVEAYLHFKMSGKISASGNCNSMYLAENFNDLVALTYKYCYTGLFQDCKSLTNPPSLPATTLSPGCYQFMFENCTSLMTAPSLPATELAYSCYQGMFGACISLTIVPSLPATELAYSCYQYMFATCSGLQVSDTKTTDAPYEWKLPTSGTFTNTNTYNQDMFYNCLGTRSSDTMTGANGESHTYYTQNQPV